MRKDLPYPHPTSAAVTTVMKANRRADTRPELVVRSLLHRRGLRFRKDLVIEVADTRPRVDIVFPKHRVAVFIDGCFWHQCPEHGHRPRVNLGYWDKKLTRTVERDARTTAALQEAGWDVLRIWEHVPPEEAAYLIEAAIAERSSLNR
jgi:DNA mismatch endonuclease (patch repair protein)